MSDPKDYMTEAFIARSDELINAEKGKMICGCGHEINIIECNECGDVIDVNAVLSAARAEGYKQALDDVMESIPSCIESMTREVIDQLKRAYEKGSDGNGN